MTQPVAEGRHRVQHRRLLSHLPLLLCVAALLSLLLPLCLSPLGVAAQYVSAPLSDCPPGRDCLGTQLATWVGPDAASIDCTSGANAAAFAGFLCAQPEGLPGAKFYLSECPSGAYCPNPAVAIECPKGSWCHLASSSPTECGPGLSICPAGGFKERFFTPLLIIAVVTLLLVMAYQWGHWRFNKRAAALKAQREAAAAPGAATTQHAVDLHAKGADADTDASDSPPQLQAQVNRPKLTLDISHVYVRVKDSEGKRSSSIVRSGSASSSGVAHDPTLPACGSTARPGEKTILHDITGTIRGGRLTAIMGPSGSGKTTFLSALLGKARVASGSITVNHQHSVREVAKLNVVGFVPQADSMLSMLTVRDLLMHAAQMRLPDHVSNAVKRERVAHVLDLLGIAHVADAVVGDETRRGISGGEMKRCSIGMEMVSDPLLLMLDEPTSGLDSAAAMQVCSALRAIAATGKIVASVIHAPRWEIFNLMDDCLLLARGGHKIYFGPVSHLPSFFASMGLTPPEHTNPADFYLDCISSERFVERWLKGGAKLVRADALAAGVVLPDPFPSPSPDGGADDDAATTEGHESQQRPRHSPLARVQPELEAPEDLDLDDEQDQLGEGAEQGAEQAAQGGLVPSTEGAVAAADPDADATSSPVVRIHLPCPDDLASQSMGHRTPVGGGNDAGTAAAGAGATPLGIEMVPLASRAVSGVSAPVSKSVLELEGIGLNGATPSATPRVTTRQLQGGSKGGPKRAALASRASSHAPIVGVECASFRWQVWWLLRRSFLAEMRDARDVVWGSLLQVLPPIALALNSLSDDSYSPPLPGPVADTCVGMVAHRCHNDVLSKFGFTAPAFFYTMIIGVAAMMWSVNTFGRRPAVFARDRTAGMSLLAYFLARNLYDLVHIARMLLIFISLFYPLSSPRGGFGRWTAAVGVLFWAACGVAYLVSCVVSASRAITIGVVLAVTFSVTSGLHPSLHVVDDWNVLQVFWYASYNRWAAEAFVILDNSGQPTGGRMDVAIRAAGYNPDNFGVDMAAIVAIGFAWRIVAFFALRRVKHKA